MFLKKGRPYTDYNMLFLLSLMELQIIYCFFPNELLLEIVKNLLPICFINSNAILATSQIITLFDSNIFDKYRIVCEKRRNRKFCS